MNNKPNEYHAKSHKHIYISNVRPDIFFFVFQKSRPYIFKKWGKKYFFISDRMRIVPNKQKLKKLCTKLYFILNRCKERTP